MFIPLAGTNHHDLTEFISVLSLISSYREILPSASMCRPPTFPFTICLFFFLSFPIFLVLSYLEFVILEFGEFNIIGSFERKA